MLNETKLFCTRSEHSENLHPSVNKSYSPVKSNFVVGFTVHEINSSPKII